MCHTPRRNRSRRHDDMKRPGLDNKAKTRPLPALNGPKGRKAERLPPNKHLMITLAAHHSAVSLSSSVSMSPWQTQSHNLNYFSFKSKMESWMYLGISGWGVGGGGGGWSWFSVDCRLSLIVLCAVWGHPMSWSASFSEAFSFGAMRRILSQHLHVCDRHFFKKILSENTWN